MGDVGQTTTVTPDAAIAAGTPTAGAPDTAKSKTATPTEFAAQAYTQLLGALGHPATDEDKSKIREAVVKLAKEYGDNPADQQKANADLEKYRASLEQTAQIHQEIDKAEAGTQGRKRAGDHISSLTDHHIALIGSLATLIPGGETIKSILSHVVKFNDTLRRIDPDGKDIYEHLGGAVNKLHDKVKDHGLDTKEGWEQALEDLKKHEKVQLAASKVKGIFGKGHDELPPGTLAGAENPDGKSRAEQVATNKEAKAAGAAAGASV